MSPGTAVAVLVDALTTIVGFGSLMIASHQGLQSLGRVLTLGVTCCLFTLADHAAGAADLDHPQPAGGETGGTISATHTTASHSDVRQCRAERRRDAVPSSRNGAGRQGHLCNA